MNCRRWVHIKAGCNSSQRYAQCPVVAKVHSCVNRHPRPRSWLLTALIYSWIGQDCCCINTHCWKNLSDPCREWENWEQIDTKRRQWETRLTAAVCSVTESNLQFNHWTCFSNNSADCLAESLPCNQSIATLWSLQSASMHFWIMQIIFLIKWPV